MIRALLCIAGAAAVAAILTFLAPHAPPCYRFTARTGLVATCEPRP